MKRVLGALEESYPGLFVVPHGAAARRASLLQQLIGGERVHVSRLADVTVSFRLALAGKGTHLFWD